mgnify:CR=1 FL=1
MQKVSKAYKESMKSALRERAYIMVSFGLVNKEAQTGAKVDEGNYAYYSSDKKIFSEQNDSVIYGTLEENFTKIDGSMFFLPRNLDNSFFYDTGMVSNGLVSDNSFEAVINFNTLPISFKGLTVTFGENFPTDFDVITSSKTVKISENTASKWSTEEVFENTGYIKFVFYRMKNPKSRLRIYNILFGYGLIYTNESVISSSLTSCVSPICAEIPQIDFSVTLKNYDRYFDIDNPSSAINFFENGQEADISYGYTITGTDSIEWIPGGHLYCSDWESDDTSATIRCCDVFRNMNGEYTKGAYSLAGKSYHKLAQDIFADMGISDYYIDPSLKNLFSCNPIPKVSQKEALQIIANACCCVLTQSRSGRIQIKSNYTPELSVSDNGGESYSDSENITERTNTLTYASLCEDFTTVDGGMLFLPRNSEEYLKTGYVSKEISDSNGKFESNPTITVTMNAVKSYYGLKLVFLSVLPSAFVIRTYNDNKPADEYSINSDEIDRVTVILREFSDCNSMQIEFTETSVPNNRIYLQYLGLDDTVDFTMSYKDMITYPKMIKQSAVKEIVVPVYVYQPGNEESGVISENITVESGAVETYYMQEPTHGYSVKINEEDSGSKVTILEQGAYFVKIRFNVSGTFKLEINGRRYRIIEKNITKQINARGDAVRWENPLVSNTQTAEKLADWLAEYYSANAEYEYETRGNPELDSTDVIYQENEFVPNMRVSICNHTIEFNQSFKGKITTRKIGG